MVILKKIRSATLMEALIATVLVIVVFIMASVILNNLLLNTFSKNTHDVEFRMNELDYAIQNNTILLPYKETYKDWKIYLESPQNSPDVILMSAVNVNNDKKITVKRSNEK